MRARTGIATDAHADRNVDVEKIVFKNRLDDFVDNSGGTMKKKKSVSSFSFSFSSLSTQHSRVLLFFLGIAFGAFLETLVRHESVRGVHKHVKGAYIAHREASKEYMKRYRETYLGEVERNYVSENENELLLESMVKEEEKKVEEVFAEEEAGTVIPEDEEGQGETTLKSLENDNGEDTKGVDRTEQSICDLKHWIIGDYVENEFIPEYLVDKLSFNESDGSVPSENRFKSQQLHKFSEEEAGQCLRNRKIWFIGDSYIRCFYNGFLDVLRGNYASPFAVRKSHYEKKVHISFIPRQLSFVTQAHLDDYNVTITNVGKKYFSLGGHMDAIKTLLTEVKDDDLIIFTLLIHDNKADWVKNEFNGSKEKAEVAYLNNVKNLVKWISTNRPKGQLVWTTSNSYIESLVPGVYRDYQTNQRIFRISSAARSYWLEAGFPVLDTFHLTGIACRTRECSQDGGHFNSAVNRAKSSLLLNYYCRPKSCEANNT